MSRSSFIIRICIVLVKPTTNSPYKKNPITSDLEKLRSSCVVLGKPKALVIVGFDFYL